MHVSLAPVPGCTNPDSYGMVCVKCNRCGRFNALCVNCGTEGLPTEEWGTIELYDGWFRVCPACRQYFTEEELRPRLQAVIPLRREEFERRG